MVFSLAVLLHKYTLIIPCNAQKHLFYNSIMGVLQDIRSQSVAYVITADLSMSYREWKLICVRDTMVMDCSVFQPEMVMLASLSLYFTVSR